MVEFAHPVMSNELDITIGIRQAGGVGCQHAVSSQQRIHLHGLSSQTVGKIMQPSVKTSTGFLCNHRLRAVREPGGEAHTAWEVFRSGVQTNNNIIDYQCGSSSQSVGSGIFIQLS